MRATGTRWLSVHAAGLFIVLVGLAAVARPGTAVSSDEGAGIYQAVLLERGTWLLAPTLPTLDPGNIQQPFLRADSASKGRAPYAKHPAYPVLLRAARLLGGVVGMTGLGVVSCVLASLAAAVIAERMRGGAGILALWLVGAASPLTIDQSLVLAHAPAAAAAGLATLASMVLLGRPGGRGGVSIAAWGAGLFVGTGLLVALRSEGILATGALAIGVVVGCGRWAPRRTGGVVAIMAAAVVVVKLTERIVIGQIVGHGTLGLGQPEPGAGLLSGRWQAFRSSWLETSYAGDRRDALLAAAACAAALFVVLQRVGATRTLQMVVGSIAAAAACGWLASSGGAPGLVPGLLPATPWLAAIVFIGMTEMRQPMIRLGATTLLVGAGAILATQYSFGGGVEWGGRFYAVLLPVAGALAAVGLASHRNRLDAAEHSSDASRSGSRSVSSAVVGGVAVVVTVGGVLAVRHAHVATSRLAADVRRAADMVAVADRVGGGLPLSDQRPIVVSPQRLWPQLLWPDFDRYQWVTAELEQLPCSFAGLRQAGVRHFVLVGPFRDDLVQRANGQGYALDGTDGAFVARVRLKLDTAATVPSCPEPSAP